MKNWICTGKAFLSHKFKVERHKKKKIIIAAILDDDDNNEDDNDRGIMMKEWGLTLETIRYWYWYWYWYWRWFWCRCWCWWYEEEEEVEVEVEAEAEAEAVEIEIEVEEYKDKDEDARRNRKSVNSGIETNKMMTTSINHRKWWGGRRGRRNDREEEEEDDQWVHIQSVKHQHQYQHHDRFTMNKCIITSNSLSILPTNCLSNQTKQLVNQDDSIEGGAPLNHLK